MIGREIRIPDAPYGGGILYDRSDPNGFFGDGGGSTGRIVPLVPVAGLRMPGAASVPCAALAPDGEPGTRVLGGALDPRNASFARASFARIAEFRLREPEL